MRIAMTKPLFAWDEIEDSPSLQTIEEFLQSVPDARLLASLRSRRGKGRNDYPVTVLWGTLLLSIVLRHATMEGCLGELRRNRGLRRLIGIEREEDVPKAWNISRFLELLGKECDDGEIHELLDEAGIEPVIENRSLWKDEEEYILPGHDGSSNIVYDEMGTVYCYDKASNPPVRHAMQYIGHEPKRRTLKYRCPAMYAGWKCPSHARCNQGKKYGKTVRVKRDIDLRRFPPIPRATKQFESLYKGRSAVERVNARIKILCGPDDGNIAGSRRFFAMIGAVMVVYLGLATLLAAAPRYDGTLGKMRLTAIARALRAKAGLKIAT